MKRTVIYKYNLMIPQNIPTPYINQKILMI